MAVDEALDWFSEKLRLMLTFEGDSADADHLLDEWPEGLLAHVANPTIPIFGVSNGCTSTGHRRALNLARSVLTVGVAPAIENMGVR